MTLAACSVCGAPSGAPIFRHDGPLSVSSTAEIIATPTIVYGCARCGHAQTPPLENLTAYYERDYNVHLESDDMDDVYDVRDGKPVLRAEHQAAIVVEKVALDRGASVIDFGCGKGMSVRALLGLRPDLQVAVFDVSDAYRRIWDQFVSAENQAAHALPASWQGRFDAVLSFFALEHAADPHAFLRAVRGLLRPGGTLHLTVPNPLRNIGDFIVVDHVNHFVPTSLRALLDAEGFTDVRIDEEAHVSAFVVDAKRGEGPGRHTELDTAAVAAYATQTRAAMAFWSRSSAALAEFERTHADAGRGMIYGSGFYGVFIASRLTDRSTLDGFLDRNPHQQEKKIFGLPVLAPDAVRDDVTKVYVGLNPALAHDIIAGVPSLRARPRTYFYL